MANIGPDRFMYIFCSEIERPMKATLRFFAT